MAPARRPNSFFQKRRRQHLLYRMVAGPAEVVATDTWAAVGKHSDRRRNNHKCEYHPTLLQDRGLPVMNLSDATPSVCRAWTPERLLCPACLALQVSA